MKRILFLSTIPATADPDTADWRTLRNSCARILGDAYSTEIASFAEIAYLADGKQSRIWHPEQGWDVGDFDLVILQRVGPEIEKAIAVAHYLQAKNVPFIDSYVLMRGKGKLAGAFMRAAAGLPTPPTFFAAPVVYAALFKQNPPFTYPFVLKADDGRKGRDNYLIHSYDELVATLAKHPGTMMIAQLFIPNDGDLRVLVLGGKVRLIIHRKGAEDSHLNNTSQGGKATLVSPDRIPRNVLRQCVRAAQLEALEVAGVDVIFDTGTGKHYFLEVNRAPQISSGAFVEEKFAAYAAMIQDIMKAAQKKSKKLLGRVEYLKFTQFDGLRVPTRVDSGAKTSALWASGIRVDADGVLHFRLFDEGSEYYTGQEITTKKFDQTVVANSTGQAEARYRVQLRVILRGRAIRASFTLANRSEQVYPVLIGRSLLRGKFIVDVSAGRPLREKEQLRAEKLKRTLTR